MQLKLYEPMQENDYYFKGYVSLKELSQLFSDYEFPEETLEKAAIHKKICFRASHLSQLCCAWILTAAPKYLRI